MANYCSACGKKLGILSSKYKAEDGSVMCSSCFKKYIQKQKELKRQEELRKQEELKKQKEKDRAIMKQYISKYLYLTNKDEDFILKVYNEFMARRDEVKKMEPDEQLYELLNGFSSYEDCELLKSLIGYEYVRDMGLYENLKFFEEENESILSTSCNEEIEKWEISYGDKFCRVWNTLEDEIKEKIFDAYALTNVNPDFQEDLKKMYKLFEKKGIKTNYSEILSIFSEIIKKNLEDELEKTLLPVYKEISMKLGKSITKEKVIKEFMKKYPEGGNDFMIVSKLLDKFNFEYEQDEIEELIERIKEEIEIEEFEQNLLNPSTKKQKIEIGDFTTLNGYEFEGYLVNLFKLLGYNVVQTSLSRDQGADLILSKGDEKIVVQAKKYDGKVSNKAVQEIVAAKNYYDADKAMLVTNSSFTKSAIELAFSWGAPLLVYN